MAHDPTSIHTPASIEQLLDPSRGPTVPHPFYVSNAKDRADMVDFLKGLDTGAAAAH